MEFADYNIAWDKEVFENPPYQEAKAVYRYGCASVMKALYEGDRKHATGGERFL